MALSSQEMKTVIENGGSVLFNGQLLTKSEHVERISSEISTPDELTKQKEQLKAQLAEIEKAEKTTADKAAADKAAADKAAADKAAADKAAADKASVEKTAADKKTADKAGA